MGYSSLTVYNVGQLDTNNAGKAVTAHSEPVQGLHTFVLKACLDIVLGGTLASLANHASYLMAFAVGHVLGLADRPCQ